MLLMYCLLVTIIVVIIHNLMAKLSIFKNLIDTDLRMLISFSAFAICSIMPFLIFGLEPWVFGVTFIVLAFLVGFGISKLTSMFAKNGGLKEYLRKTNILRDEKYNWKKNNESNGKKPASKKQDIIIEDYEPQSLYENADDFEDKALDDSLSIGDNIDNPDEIDTNVINEAQNVDVSVIMTPVKERNDSDQIEETVQFDDMENSQEISAETLTSQQVLMSHDEYSPKEEYVDNVLNNEHIDTGMEEDEVIQGLTPENLILLAAEYRQRGEFDKTEEICEKIIHGDNDIKVVIMAVLEMCAIYKEVGQEELGAYILKGYLDEYADMISDDIRQVIKENYGDNALEVL